MCINLLLRVTSYSVRLLDPRQLLDVKQLTTQTNFLMWNNLLLRLTSWLEQLLMRDNLLLRLTSWSEITSWWETTYCSVRLLDERQLTTQWDFLLSDDLLLTNKKFHQLALNKQSIQDALYLQISGLLRKKRCHPAESEKSLGSKVTHARHSEKKMSYRW